jgi:DNA-binding CsgD family transcriptional regulator/PAS domain-containing protein
LVTDFFRAATGATSWDRALDGMQAAFSARAAVIQAVDLTDGRILAFHLGGPPMQECILEYLRGYHAKDPRRSHLLSRGLEGVDQWWHCHEHFDDRFVANNEFYVDFAPAYGLRYLATVMLRPSENVLVAFALELPPQRGPLNADEREFAQRLGIHMREALLAHERVRKMAAQALAGHGLLQAFAYPMWLMDVDRFVLFANDAAKRELGSENRAAMRGNHFVLRRDAADRALSERLRQMADQGHGASSAVDLRVTASDPPIWLHLSWMVPGQVLGAFGDRPQVLATLFDPAYTRSLDPFALANLFGLTPTEARVAARLADGATAEGIALEHGTALSTVRTHIRQLLAKFNLSRTTDIIRLLRQGEALWAQAGGVDPAR